MVNGGGSTKRHRTSSPACHPPAKRWGDLGEVGGFKGLACSAASARPPTPVHQADVMPLNASRCQERCRRLFAASRRTPKPSTLSRRREAPSAAASHAFPKEAKDLSGLLSHSRGELAKVSGTPFCRNPTTYRGQYCRENYPVFSPFLSH